MDSHYWSTNYGPVAGAAPYQIPPKISAVIGGKASGGASVMTPAGGFSQKPLGVLLTGYQAVETPKRSTGTAPSTTRDPAATANQKKAISGGSIAALIGSCVFGLLLSLAPTVRVQSIVKRPQ